MQTSTVADVIRQKKLANLPVLNYREENGTAVIEVRLRAVKPVLKEPAYDPEKLIAVLRSMQFSVGHPTNVTADIRRDRNSSPPGRRRRANIKTYFDR